MEDQEGGVRGLKQLLAASLLASAKVPVQSQASTAMQYSLVPAMESRKNLPYIDTSTSALMPVPTTFAMESQKNLPYIDTSTYKTLDTFVNNTVEFKQYVQKTEDTVYSKRLNEMYTIGSHNTLTYNSRTWGAPLATPNQLYDFDTMLQIATKRSEPFVVMWDFDLFKDRTGKLITTHGGPTGKLFNISNQDISYVLERITEASLTTPHMIQLIRSENYISAADFIKVVPEAMKSRIGMLPYGKEFPTVGEVVSSGKNIFIFFQNNTDEVNTETALYNGIDIPIHAQDRYFWRIKWNKMDCITQSPLKEECMILDNVHYLEGKPAFVLADAYRSLLGGDTGRHNKTIGQMADIINVSIPNAIKLGRKYGIQLPDGGGVILRDFVTPIDYASCSILNTIPVQFQDVIQTIVTSIHPFYVYFASQEASSIIGTVALCDPFVLIANGRLNELVVADIRLLTLSAVIGYLTYRGFKTSMKRLKRKVTATRRRSASKPRSSSKTKTPTTPSSKTLKRTPKSPKVPKN